MRAQTIINRAIKQAQGQSVRKQSAMKQAFKLFYQGKPIAEAYTYTESIALNMWRESKGYVLQAQDIVSRARVTGSGGYVALFLREEKTK